MDDEVVVDNTRMASILNTWYCSVFTDEDVTNMPEVEILCEEGEDLETVEFSVEKVNKKLEELRPTASPGPNKVSAKVGHDLASVEGMGGKIKKVADDTK